MTTQQVANRLVELCRQGKIEETQNELFADNVVSTEMSEFMGSKVVEGKAAVAKKGEDFNATVEEFHSAEISDPLVAGNCFSIAWTMDATMKGRGRMKMEEICTYVVKDGKIVSEQFFY